MTLDSEDIERIAGRVVELLNEEPGADQTRYVDAAFVARKLGVDRDWVYAHARELGGMRLGGPRGRLRFDLLEVRRQLDSHAQRTPAQHRRIRPRKRPPRRLGNVDLLPYTEVRSTGQIGGRATRQRPRPDNGR